MASTFSRAVLSGATNLAVVGSDAHGFLGRHVPPGSVAGVFVNYPEPPQQRGGAGAEAGDGASQAQHMLNGSFFSKVLTVRSWAIYHPPSTTPVHQRILF